MAKAKPVKKAQSKGSSKPSKPIKAAKIAVKSKKDVKKDLKKPIVQAKKAQEAKPAKAGTATDLKKSSASAANTKSAEVEKNNAKAQKTTTKSKLKTKKTEKPQDDEMDSDLLNDDFGESEIAEYEDDLKAVEEEDEDDTEILSDDEDSAARDEEVYLTDSEGRRLCRVRDCDQVASVDGYCRYHYLLLWKRIQTRKIILIDGKLEKYVDDLMSRYPDKFLEVIRKDLRTEKDFTSVIQEMELDESALAEQDSDDDVQSFADEIRGIGDAPPAMDDDGDY